MEVCSFLRLFPIVLGKLLIINAIFSKIYFTRSNSYSNFSKLDG